MSGCELQEHSERLINPISFGSAALAIEGNALICFDYEYESRCETFDGKSSISTYSTRSNHWGGKLGLFKGQPTTVGDNLSGGETETVETLRFSGWGFLPSFPRYKNKSLKKFIF